MNISNLYLKNYRNYADLDIELSPNVNIFIGKNAQGKSNILESLFVLALTKSYMNVKDRNLIKDGASSLLIRATLYNKFGKNKLSMIISADKKTLKIDSIEIKKYSDYISKMKVLIFSPYNVNFVKEGPAVRRKSINTVLSQLSKSYLVLLQNYNMLLKKRNVFLKKCLKMNSYNIFYLEVLNEKFVKLAIDVVNQRKCYVNRINEKLKKIYNEIMGEANLYLDYNCNIDKFLDIELLKEMLQSNLEKEQKYGVTLIGPHRDDFVFYLDGKDLFTYGSQGQIRAAILSLKLAELLLFKEVDDEYPILLLDDIFSELDVEKRNKLIKYISNEIQTIITTTDINMIDDSLLEKAKIFVVENGTVAIERKKECKDE